MKESGRGREKPKAILDTNVVVAAIFWQGSARECLARFARRQFQMFVSEAILEEYSETAWDLRIEEGLAQNPQPWLNWISSRATILLPITLTEAVSADPDDEKFLECALAAKADYIVTRDRDLLELEKPFGIRVVDDRGFLRGLDRLRAR